MAIMADVNEVVDTLATWHPEIADLLYEDLDDLEDEFDRGLPLPDPTRNKLGPFSRNSKTSKKAAFDNMPRSGSQRRRVLEAIENNGLFGYTRHELSKDLKILDSAADARVWELLQVGWVVETERTRPTSSGSQAAVLILSDRGKRQLRDASV